MDRTDVLIAGAGPTGLLLALWLTKVGIRVRIIDKTLTPGTTSRALVFHARNMELYHQLGIEHLVREGGIEFKAANIWIRGHQIARIPFGDLDADISPYSYSMIYPQDKHEQMLVAQLAALGVQVERGTTLVSFEEVGDTVKATIDKGGVTSECTASYLAGCDGARSTVREKLNMSFTGGTYDDTFYVADIQSSGPAANGDMHISLDDADFLAVFPMQGEGNVRLVSAVKQADSNKTLTWEDVNQNVLRRVQLDVKKVNWFSTYKVHHRLAGHFRQGRAFLLGDAAHIHSPVGGQGMNTGLGDAINLAWKLAAVIKGESQASILDSYEPERIAFAKRLVATTDRVFNFVSSDSSLAGKIRVRAPYVLTKLFRFAFMRRLLYKTLSQVLIKYPDSMLSEGRAGSVRGGDRMLWVKDAGGATDNFSSLGMDWQIHCYGSASPELTSWCAANKMKLTVYAWTTGADAAGLKKNAAYVIRPDSYVGLAERDRDVMKIAAYCARFRPLGQKM